MCLLVDTVHNPVPASSATAFRRRSYTASTGKLTCRGSHSRHDAHSQRFITNIPRRVQVAIYLLPACWTYPHPLCEFQVGLIAATAIVYPARWEIPTNPDDLAPIPLGLVAQLPMYFAQACVSERLCQSPPFEHPSHVQVLNPNQRCLSRDLRRRLMLCIGAPGTLWVRPHGSGRAPVCLVPCDGSYSPLPVGSHDAEAV